MALQSATIVDMGKVIGGVQPDLASAIGYKETVGTACKNPNGYTQGSCFVNTADGYLYEATTAISYGTTLTSGTNCSKTDVCTKISELNADIIIVTHTETTARSVAANSVTEYTVTSDIPNGYRPISVVVRRHGTDVATLFGCIIDSSGTSTPVWRVQVWNFHTGAASLKPKFDIVCKKE